MGSNEIPPLATALASGCTLQWGHTFSFQLDSDQESRHQQFREEMAATLKHHLYRSYHSRALAPSTSTPTGASFNSKARAPQSTIPPVNRHIQPSTVCSLQPVRTPASDAVLSRMISRDVSYMASYGVSYVIRAGGDEWISRSTKKRAAVRP